MIQIGLCKSARSGSAVYLRRMDPGWRLDRIFLFVLCALIFRREAMRNTHFKLRGRLLTADVQLVESLTGSDLRVIASDLARGANAGDAFRERPAIAKLFHSMSSVDSSFSWNAYYKKPSHLCAVSVIIQLGQPLIWMINLFI